MRGSFFFFGVLLCVLSGGSFEESSFRNYLDTAGCGDSNNCKIYCEVCAGFQRADCYKALIHHLCSDVFTKEMDNMNSSSLCNWDKVKSPYNKFTLCTEEIADCLWLPWPNKLVEQTFVNMHTQYFQECPTETLRDPPPNVVFALVMTPICLIPAMVVLVVLKTKNGDRRS